VQDHVAVMSTHDPIKDAFEEAKEDFFKSLKDPDVYDFSQFTSINDVYDTTDKIQQEQNRTGTLQGLNRIRPYLDCLTQYSGVIETFTQVKPDLLCLLWVCEFLLRILVFKVLLTFQTSVPMKLLKESYQPLSALKVHGGYTTVFSVV